MAKYFRGHSTSEHYEKDIKDITVGQWIYLALFLVFFAGTAASIVFVKPGFIVACFGLIFLWAGGLIPVVMEQKLSESLVSIIFLIIGAVAIAVGGIMISGILPLMGIWYIYVGLWCVLGIIMIVFSNNKLRMGKKCSKSVIATCRTGERKELTYYLNGDDYIIEAAQYFGPKCIGYEEGSRVELWINPKKPEQVIPKKKADGMFLTFGISCVFVAIFGAAVITLVTSMMP